MSNISLNTSKANKNDEFYTKMEDIESELSHYTEHFRDKVIYCNCDNPYKSNFVKYFLNHFSEFKLKKLLATCYAETNLFSGETPYKLVVDELSDDFNLNDHITMLDGDEDFRSPECIELLEQSDIVVTNPPFSMFREFVDILMGYGKDFISIGNQNAAINKSMIHYIIDNSIHIGYDFKSMSFIDGDNCSGEKTLGYICWYTTFDIDKRNMIEMTETYSPEKYPKYDNYDAINVGRVKDIPKDYYGLMAVPLTFLDKYNSNQFEIVDAINRYVILDVMGTNEDVARRKSHTCNINGKATYFRIIIKRKQAY